MYYRLYSNLQVNKVLYKYQFGFRKNYSTSLALIDVIDNIYSNISNDKFCGGVYLDLRRHLTLLIMIFYYTNCIIMAYVELHMIGLETI